MRKILAFAAALCMLASLLCGCSDTTKKIAGNVADAAMKELEKQVRETLEEQKIDVIELKTAFGDINDEGGKTQLYIAALIRTESTSIPEGCVKTLSKVFTDAGLVPQTSSTVSSSYLAKKRITYSHSDFSGGNYYTLFGYHSDLSKFIPSGK